MPDALDHPADRPLFIMRLHPHRSLTPQQSRMVIGCIGLCGLLTSMPFVLIGAWPVLGFMGIDVLAVYVAFRAVDRSARAYEDVHVTTLQLTVAKVSAAGRRAEWRFNPNWVRLRRKDHEEFGLLRVDLVSGGRALEVAGFLGPDQKAAFADRLGRALAEARRGLQWS